MLLSFPSPCYLTGQGIGWSLPRPKPPGYQSPRCFGEWGGPYWCSWPKQPSHQRSLCHLSWALLSPWVLWIFGSRCQSGPCALWSGSAEPCTLTLDRCQQLFFKSRHRRKRNFFQTQHLQHLCTWRTSTLKLPSFPAERRKGFVVDRNRRVEFQLQYQDCEGVIWQWMEKRQDWLAQSLHANTYEKFM